MLTPSQIEAIRARIEAASTESGQQALQTDGRALIAEVVRLSDFHQTFTKTFMAKLDALTQDMETLETENARLRRVTESTYFERDACVGLIARLARGLGLRVGTGKFQLEAEKSDGSKSPETQDRVVVDLPSGQVSWEFLASEAHLFSELPAYEQALLPQSVGEIYSKVLNPNLAPFQDH